MAKSSKKIKEKIGKDISKISKNGIVAEFKEFISQGSVMNLAVGVIIGGAFQAIVNSLVTDILMPIISLFTKGINFNSWFVTLSTETYASLKEAKDAGAAVLTYGNFISAAINFLVMAVVIFFLVKFFNKISSKVKIEEETEEPSPRLCDFCFNEVDDKATRCPHCTSKLELTEDEDANKETVDA